MLAVCLISIGNELLSGKTINSNATYLAKNLTTLGFRVMKIITIPDDPVIVPTEISQTILSNQFHLILITGGLGPTWDDSTSVFLAEALGVPTELNADALSIVTKRYQSLFKQELVDNARITPAREKMAILPVGALPIDNPIGTAPGIFYEHKATNTWIYCFPGVPREMKEMYRLIEAEIVVLTKEKDVSYFEVEFTTTFTDESLLAPYLAQVRQKFDVWIKSLPKAYQKRENIHLIISKSANSENDVKKEVLEAKKYLQNLINSS